MTGKSRFALLLPMLTLAAGSAGAAGVGIEAEPGHQLAQTLCTSCHAIEPGKMAGPYAEVPAFAAVAALPSTTASSLNAFLTTPHGQMPDIKLTDQQRGDLITYILSLKQK